MDITRVPVHDVDFLRAWYDVMAASAEAEGARATLLTFPELVERARAAGEFEREDYWLGRSGGEDVAAYRLRIPQRDNLDLTMLDLAVRPADRRRGHGSRLLAHALDRVRDIGRHRVFVEVVEPTDGSGSAGAALAARTGFRRALEQTRRTLDLRTLDPSDLEALEQEALAHAAGYDLVAWTGRVPDEHLEAQAALISRMTTDAPLDGLDLEPELWDGNRIRAREAVLEAQRRTRYVTAARSLADSSLVAYTDLVVTEHDPVNAFQWDTLVHADHRGHRLGLLVKVANLRRLLAEAPQAEQVHTWNADSNRHMVAINEAMGFRPVLREVEWQLDLPH